MPVFLTPVSALLPPFSADYFAVERKESHEQLCFGSHTKAEKGNWLLVFDNS